jgi:hypothetical protein
MPKKIDLSMKKFIRSTLHSFNTCVSDLETVTEFYDSQFEGLDAKKLPEYEAAINAIRAYKEAFARNFEKKYRESEASSH